MNTRPELMYLDLLKKTLSFMLWPEPPIAITESDFKGTPVLRATLCIASKVLARRNLKLVQARSFSERQRVDGEVWPGYADTMIGLKRLDNLQCCIETVLKENIEGHVIETGVWRGGACIFMRAVLAAYGVKDRKVFVADSFEGLPKPDSKKYPHDKGDTHHTHTVLAVSQEDVEHNFKKYGMLDEQVVFIKGWFKDTLPQAPVEKLSLLRLDGDMYESTMDSLVHLYPKVSEGGFCIIDDYALAGCKAAVDDYRAAHGIESDLKVIDWTGRYWRKGA